MEQPEKEDNKTKAQHNHKEQALIKQAYGDNTAAWKPRWDIPRQPEEKAYKKKDERQGKPA